MVIAYRPAREADLAAMAALAARCQHDPARHILYVGLDAASIEADVSDVDEWPAATVVAELDHRLIGWMLAEVDQAMGRVWWWGPFVDGAAWDEVADRLYRSAEPLVAGMVTEQEACGDDRSDAMRRWSERNGFTADTASVLLRRDPDVEVEPRSGPPAHVVRALAEADHATVVALHDEAFPGTHTTGEVLVRSDHPRLVIEGPDGIAGYVASERQSDGSGYIDYLAVDPTVRGRGLGRALVDQACRDLFADGATFAHLTVREDNPAARALYRSLGFVEERLARPYRRGFLLP